MKRKTYNKLKYLFQTTYMVIWSICFMNILFFIKYVKASELMMFIIPFIITTPLIIEKGIYLLKQDKNRKFLIEQIKSEESFRF